MATSTGDTEPPAEADNESTQALAIIVDGDVVEIRDGSRSFRTTEPSVLQQLRVRVTPDAIRVVALADPHPAFRTLSEQDVEDRLARDDEDVVREVARLCHRYIDRLTDLRRCGLVEIAVLERVALRWPIESVVLRQTADIVKEFPELLV